MDLVIYKAEALTDEDHLPHIPHEASKCFRHTKIIGGDIIPEISNVGFFDVSDKHVAQAISQETLFIHGSSHSGGSAAISSPPKASASDINTLSCTGACGSEHSAQVRTGASTFCDESCSTGWSPAGPRLGGHNCGAGDPSQYGSTCRLCYTNEDEALAADRTLASLSTDPSTPDAHVVMCDTTQPPQASRCTTACQDMADTVCDYRCGSGRYGDFNCNWRGVDSTCRLCFHETSVALLADEVAKAHGGRVVMCNTHEPPLPIGSKTKATVEDTGHRSADTGDGLPSAVSSQESKRKLLAVADESNDPAATAYIGTTTRGHICAFMRGFVELLPETKVSVSSVLELMPGMRVAIATDAAGFQEFARAFAHLPDVAIELSKSVSHGALIADEVCGKGTRLIYYIEAGQVVSRTFTEKDTHTVLGNLIVSLANADEVPPVYARRALGSTVLLGVTTPTFTHGSDLILPAETNAQLRAVLGANQRLVAQTNAEDGDTGRQTERVYEYLADVAKMHRGSASIYVPEVLAALAYSRSPRGVTFVNIREWSHEHLFSEDSIWDIPMVKPRFGCSFDTSLTRDGYDVGGMIAKELEGFKLGASCERGFKSVDRSKLDLKADRELGDEGEQGTPTLQDYHIAVMYRTCARDAKIFSTSIATVIEHLSGAFEVVVVVVEADVALFESIVQPLRTAVTFPIRVIGEPELMDGNVQQAYSKLRADLYTEGEYVLHLDSDAVVFEDVTPAHVFHDGMPVQPFRRYREEETLEGWATTLCWQNGTSFAVGEDVAHEFSIFNAHVYPRSMYPAAREFIEQRHGMSFVDFLATRRGSCMHPNTMAEWTADERAMMFSGFNFIGAYLWYHMPDAVHWLAMDSVGTQPDLGKFEWVCKANRRYAPADPAELEQYEADYRKITSIDECNAVTSHWQRLHMSAQ
ncbi:hypothetical protein Esi_0218_0031 [Ectocarpus siliculosus]|uniref:Uncharacterized protein n=1 Tax=Ectocarpus siliculosus TaxID=2880 RepID=D7FRS3_ECTSI|nr:hypothetical protein Esi_0218_0031 [Ectocarpus siliculosus]|eukprot:CBJ30864.1 hypothetical protein Esi_0218_0031 [Ectocarpus siliculosus]